MASERYNKALERARKMKAGSAFGSTGVQSKEEDTQMTTSKRSDRYNRLLERVHTEGLHIGITEKDVNQFYKDVQTYDKDYETMRNSGSWASIMDDSAATARSSTLEDLNKRAKKIKLWADVNKSRLGEEGYSSVIDYLDTFNKSQGEMAKDYQSARDYYSNWKSEKEYTDYINSDQYEADQRAAGYYQKYGDMDYMQLRTAANALPEGEERTWVDEYAPSKKTEKDLQEDLTWLKGQQSYLEKLKGEGEQLTRLQAKLQATTPDAPGYAELKAEYDDMLRRYPSLSVFQDIDGQIEKAKTDIWKKENEIKYFGLDKNEDFAQQSQYKGAGTSWYGGGSLLDEINDPEHTDKWDTAMTVGKYVPLDPVTNIYSNIQELWNYENTHLMEPGEREKFNYLWNTEGEEAAKAYLDYLQPTLNERSNFKVAQFSAKVADKAPVLSSLLSTPVKLMGGLGLVDAVAQKAIRSVSGDWKPIDYNRDGTMFSTAANVARGTVSQKIANSTGSQTLAGIYNLGMSMQDSAAVAAMAYLAPPLAKVGTALLSTSSGTDAMLDAVARGASDNQAIAMGLLSAGFEYIFEKYELESLLGQGKNIWAAVGKQALSEGFGEGATEIANMLADAAVMGEKSNWQQSIQSYIDKGMDPKEAKKQAFKDAALQVGQAAAGGIISGGIMGGGMAAINGVVGRHNETVAQRDAAIDNYYAEQHKGDIPSLVSQALEINPDDQAAKAAKEKLDNGVELSPQEIRQLAEPVAAANMEKTAAGRLQELGETGDVAAISKAAVKSATGQKLTAEEKAALKDSQHGTQVVKELKETHKKEQSAIDAYAKESVKKARQLDKAVRKAVKNADKSTNDAEDQTDTTPDTVDPPIETPTEGQYEAATDGVTTMKSTGDPVKIKEIASVKNGKMTLRLEDGSEVDASDVQHGTEQEAIIYDAVASLEGFIDGKSATDFADHLMNLAKRGEPISDTFVDGIRQAYMYGYEGHPPASISAAGTLAADLTEKQRNVAYRRGIKYREEQVATRKGSGMKGAKKTAAHQKGGVFAEQDGKKLDTSKLSKHQYVGVSFANRMAKKFGMSFYFYRSYMKDGVRVYKDRSGNVVKAENGFYDPSDRSIHIDLNAGSFGRGTVLFTISHELVHFMKDTAPQHYEKLAELLVQGYAKQGQSVDDLIALQQAEAEESGRTLTREEAYEEVVADSMEEILADGRVMELMQMLEAEDHSLAGKVKKFFQDIMQLLKETIRVYSGFAPDSREGNMVREMRDIYAQLQEIFAEGIYEGGKNHSKMGVNENTTGEGGVRYMVRDGKITANSTEQERYEQLRNINLKISTVDRSKIKGIDLEEYNTRKKSAVTPGFIQLAQSLGILNVDFQNSYIDFSFQYSIKNLRKSAHHQLEFGGTYQDYVEAMSCFEDLIKNAIPIEVHGEKKLGTSRENPELQNVYVLVSAYKDSKSIVPVELVVKELRGRNNTLYMAVVLTKIDLEVMDTGVPSNTGDVPHLFSRSTISLTDLFRNVNPKDGRFLKYVPDNFLNAEQRAAKQAALERQKSEYETYKLTKHSTRKGETTSYTPRSLLANADDSVAQTPVQQKALKEYRELIGKLQLEETQLKEDQQQLEAIQDRKGQEAKRQQLELRRQIIATKDHIAEIKKELGRYEGYVPIKDMVARERKRVVQEQLADYREKYGTIKAGEKKVRDDSLPVSTDGKNKVSRTARTVKGAKATTDEFAELIDEQVAAGKLAYLPIKNNATTKAAQERIKRDGWNETLEDWKRAVTNGRVSADLTATGALLLRDAAQNGDKETWLDILYHYQSMGTSAGQAIQAMRILKQLNPEDRLGIMKRSIAQLIKDTGIKFSVDDIVGKIDPDVIEAYQQAETYEEEDWAFKEIGATIAQYVPSTLMDKFTALRYLNMLGNLRTQVRNIAGNTAMGFVTMTKNATAIGIEQLAYLASGGKFQRTKAFASPAMIKAAAEDFNIVRSMVLGGGKYTDSGWASSQLAQAVRDNQRIFKAKLLEMYRGATNWAMDQGDLMFSKVAYSNALAGYLRANGIKDSDFSEVDTELMDKARIYAVKEAQEATFRDTNVLSEWISKVGRRSDTLGAVKVISEGVMPFRKTPANILVRAEEYSPIGFVNAVYLMTKKAASTTKLTEKGNVIGAFARGGEMITGADIVNSLSKGLTGTGLFFLGMWLASVGVLVGGAEDDEDLEYFQQMNGQQNYALKIGDTYITIDFLSPAAIPMFVGAQIQKLSEDGGVELKDWESALTSIADPLVEMSMLQGVNDTLDNIRFSENNTLQLMISAAANYMTQGLTNSWLGQTERGLENSRQTTYVDGNSALPSWMQRTLGKASAKTPFWDYNQIPYINAWGEEETNPAVPANMAYNMLSPSYVNTETVDNVSQELTRLNEVQDDVNVFPSTPDREYNNEPLSAEEYVALAKAQGQTQRKIIEGLVASEVYAGLTDTYKAKAIAYAYTYAKESAQIEVLGRSGFSSKWMGKIEGDVVEGILDHIMSDKDAVAGMIREREPRIKKAAEAKASGDTDAYLEIVEEIVEEGHFKWKDVSAAVKDEVKEMEED